MPSDVAHLVLASYAANAYSHKSRTCTTHWVTALSAHDTCSVVQRKSASFWNQQFQSISSLSKQVKLASASIRYLSWPRQVAKFSAPMVFTAALMALLILGVRPATKQRLLLLRAPRTLMQLNAQVCDLCDYAFAAALYSCGTFDQCQRT